MDPCLLATLPFPHALLVISPPSASSIRCHHSMSAWSPQQANIAFPVLRSQGKFLVHTLTEAESGKIRTASAVLIHLWRFGVEVDWKNYTCGSRKATVTILAFLLLNPRGKIKKSRPRNTWLHDLEAYEKKTGHAWRQLEKWSQNQDAWKAGPCSIGVKGTKS